ncbi:MAG: SHOCT domain-containing protein [Pseudomonadota bacterium]
MSDLTEFGRNTITDVANRYRLSQDAVEHMARAVATGGGTMAQFNVPELGGSGQWMMGGMTMVGDMFNNGLQATVSNLCGELSNAQASGDFFTRPQTIAGSSWWPEELGSPASVGGQNSTRYAYFPNANRIAFDPGNGAPVILLDTLNNAIGGFSQQQSGPGDPFMGITFSSQFGQFPLSSLPRVGDAFAQSHPAEPEPTAPYQPVPETTQQPGPEAAQQPAAHITAAHEEDILSTIERLAKLRDANALTEDEFSAKKAELLARL